MYFCHTFAAVKFNSKEIKIKEKQVIMAEHRIKKSKIEDTVVGAYQKIEDTVVGTYQKIEDTVVGTYQKIEDKFVEKFLEEGEDE